MKKLFITLGALALTVVMALAQEPTREQVEAALAQTPKIPNTEKVTIGHLENGLTYYIRHNELPAGRAEFYLATNVGAIQENQPDQDGLAHFLEHMCFNGTEHFPGKAILDYLRSIGAEFGRNINAATAFEETRYMLNNMPVQRETVVDSCLMILADYSHYVLNEPAEIDAERGVIIEERRQRRSASWRNMEAALPYCFGPDSKLAQCTLIGTQEHLETFKYESLKDFYETWYHPGNQAVIVVGDVDVARTEAKIKEIFGVIPAKENPLKKPIQEIADHDEPRVGIHTDPENTNPYIQFDWHSPANPEIINATTIGMAQGLIKDIISAVMSERINDITSKADSPFFGGHFGITELIYEDIDAVEGEVALKSDNILEGFRAFYTEIERLKRYGITDDELARVKTNYLSGLEASVNRAATRQNSEFIGDILQNFFDKYPILEPEDRLEIIQAMFAQVNPTLVNQVLGQLYEGHKNLVIFYAGPEKEGIQTPTQEQILKVMEEVEASEIAAPEGGEVPEAFLDPAKLKGAKVAKTANVIYGATEWTLKNGVKVVVYPTDLQKNQILFDIFKDGGTSLIPAEDLASFDINMISLFQSNSGVSQFSGTTVQKMLTGKNLSVTPYFNNTETGIEGNSTVKDLETALQLVYLMFTDPRFDQEEWDNGINQLTSLMPNIKTQPSYQFESESMKLMYNNHPRHQMLSEEKLAKASLKAVETQYRKLFADAAGATLFIVGDINPEAVKPLVEKYIGSIPKGKKPLQYADNGDHIAMGKIQKVIEVDMQTPKSTVFQLYHADVPFTYDRIAALEALSYIMDMKYTNSLREEEGGTYGASAYGSMERRPYEIATFEVQFDCKPALCDKLREIAVREFQEMAENGPTDEEVAMAKLNQQKNLPEKRQKNGWWMSNLERKYIYDEDRDALYEAAVNNLSKESIQAVAKEVLSQGNFLELVMKPANSAETE
ncbi:MAG: insulinase family protein [Bacteroidales bacterium]|nr:insulinase family protein [Bacteroidales bacterium]